MFEHDIRWYALVPVTLILGFFVLFAETSDVWGAFPMRPDWFWCLAVYAALKSPPTSSIVAFAWCGLARDFILGPKPGSAMLAFVAVGWAVLYWKPIVADRGLPSQAFMAGVGAVVVSFVRHMLDSGRLAYKLWDWMLVAALGDGVLTCLVYVPAVLVLSLPSFRPWRERGGYHYL